MIVKTNLSKCHEILDTISDVRRRFGVENELGVTRSSLWRLRLAMSRTARRKNKSRV